MEHDVGGLAILVSLRAWPWCGAATLEVRSDSAAALSSLVKLSSESPSLYVIASEIARDCALQNRRVDIATHIPGVANNVADALSRLWAPDPKAFPSILFEVPRTLAPERSASFWRTAVPPRSRRMQGRGTSRLSHSSA